MTYIQSIQEKLREFVSDRDWEQYHNPKNLSMALIVEAAELVEHFQWLQGEQSAQLPKDKLEEVKHEIADIFIYLLRICDELQIDLVDATQSKIELNKAKYPVEKVRGASKKYTEY